MNQQRTRWGKPRDFAVFCAIVAIIGAAAAIHLRWLDWIPAALLIGLLLVGSIVLLARMLTHRDSEAPIRMGWAGVLPAKLRRWALGESDEP